MLKGMEWERLNGLIASLYGISSSTAMRTAFLRKLMNLINFDFADFNLGQKKDKGYPSLVDPVVVSIFPESVEERFTTLYEEKFFAMDYVNWIFSHQSSIVYRESDLIDPKVRCETAFYKEYLSKFDLGIVAGISVISAGVFVGAITLYKSEKKGDFSEKDLYILKQLLPHLQNKLASTKEAVLKNKKHIFNTLIYSYSLTKREINIIGEIYEGLTNAEISKKSKISINTTKSHISNIFQKLEVRSRTQLIQFLIRHQLIDYWS